MRSVLLTALALAAVVAGGCGSSSSSSTSSSSSSPSSSSTPAAAGPPAGAGPASSFAGRPGFEGAPIQAGSTIAPASTTGTGDVHGVTCGATEQLAYHIHAHLQIYVDGAQRALPGGIGIPSSTVQNDPQAGPVAAGGQCIYWLHTHAPDGIIHVESPTARIYTLGDFFDEWHQPLTTTRVGSATGPVVAFVNGKPWKRDPRLIPLSEHAVIQLDVGQPAVPFRPMSWAGLAL